MNNILFTFNGHTDRILSVAFSPDGKQALTGSSDTTAILWNLDTYNQIQFFKGHTKEIRSVAISPDGKQALTGSLDNTAILWDINTGKKLHTFEGHSNGILAVAFSPKGNQAITGSRDRTAILWDTNTGKSLRTLQGHRNEIVSVAFSPDGRHVLTGSSDDTAILWDAETGQSLHTFQGHLVAFSPNGKQVLTGTSQKEAVLWNIAGVNSASSPKEEKREVGHSTPSPSVKPTERSDQEKTVVAESKSEVDPTGDVLLHRSFLRRKGRLESPWGINLGTWNLAEDGLHIGMEQPNKPAWAMLPNDTWKNYLLEFEFQHQTATFGCFVRLSTPTNCFYALRLSRKAEAPTPHEVEVRLTRVYPNAMGATASTSLKETELGKATCHYPSDQFAKLSLYVINNTFSLSIDNQAVFIVADSAGDPPLVGGIGLGAVAEDAHPSSAIVRELWVKSKK